jgi:hypothetical protein
VYYLPDSATSTQSQAYCGRVELGAITQYGVGYVHHVLPEWLERNTNLTIGNVNGGPSSLFAPASHNQRPRWPRAELYRWHGWSRSVLNPNTQPRWSVSARNHSHEHHGIGSCADRITSAPTSIDKNWRVWGERVRIQFCFDMFNLFNHANFNGGSSINGTQGGSIANSVNCGPANSAGLYQPCSMTNSIISAQTLGSTVGQAT